MVPVIIYSNRWFNANLFLCETALEWQRMLVACNEFNHSVCVHCALWSHSLVVNAFPHFDPAR